jgi:hypothetical protein
MVSTTVQGPLGSGNLSNKNVRYRKKNNPTKARIQAIN